MHEEPSMTQITHAPATGMTQALVHTAYVVCRDIFNKQCGRPMRQSSWGRDPGKPT